jgi:hypothetical protein
MVIRPVWTGVADGAPYMSSSSPELGVRVSNVAYPPRWNSSLRAKTGFLLSIGPPTVLVWFSWGR